MTGMQGNLLVASLGNLFTVSAKKSINGVVTEVFSTNLTFNSGETTTRTASTPAVLLTSPIIFGIDDYIDIFVHQAFLLKHP